MDREKNADGTITYDASCLAAYIYYEVFRDEPAQNGNSVECCLMPLEPGGPLIALSYTGMSINQNSDGNTILAIRFSSYVSGKHISAEIRDTLSVLDPDPDNVDILSSVVTVTESASLLAPTAAQVGQIVRVKAVDADGKIAETETVDMPSGGELTWHEVIDHETTEAINDLRISTDKSGRLISGYHAIGMILCISVPADSTQLSVNGTFWVYPVSADFLSSSLRYIQTVPSWKTIARDYNYLYAGNNRAMYLSNALAANATNCPDTVLDGIRVYVHSNDGHIPVGTKVRCLVLSKGWEA